MSKRFIYLILFLFFLIKSSECDKIKSDDQSLYDNSTAIISSTPTYLKSFILDKRYSSLVFFYQNWCDKCIKQIEVNLQLEKDLVYWQNVLKFVVINSDSNVSKDFNVSKSFEYRLTNPNKRTSQLLHPKDASDKNELLESILSALLALNVTNDEFTQSGWPKIKPLDKIDTSSFDKKTLIFVNQDNSIEQINVSLTTILDFSSYISDLNILNCNESIFTSSNFTKAHTKTPALYEFDDKQKAFNLIDQGLDRIEFRNLTITKFLTDKWKPIEVNTVSKIKNITCDQTPKPENATSIYFRDLNNALRKVIFSDFTRFKVLSEEKVQIMTNLTIQFREYFPYDNENTRRFLRRISQWFKERNQTESLRVDKVKAIIRAGAEGFLPTEQPYISCKGSQPHLRGYPCSIWLLFHSLTVQEYLKHINQTNGSAKKSNFTQEPHSVLRSMKGYMKHFFLCTECVEQFEQDAADLDSKLVNLNSSILWLWSEHNKINLQLKNKSNDDPEWPKQVYPSYEACATCYLKKPENVDTFDSLNGIWNETEVVNFLVNQYRKESLLKGLDKSSAMSCSLSLILISCSILVTYLMNRFI